MNWKSLKHEPPRNGMKVVLMDSRTESIRMMPCEWGIGSVGENWTHWIEYTPPAPEKEEWEVAWVNNPPCSINFADPTILRSAKIGFKAGFKAGRGNNET